MAKNSIQTQSTSPITAGAQNFTAGEINALLSILNNQIIKLGEATGAVVSVEIRMRLICQLCEPARVKLVELVADSQRKRKSNKYWECDPAFLAQTIDIVFGVDLNTEDREEILKFPSVRAKLLHGELISLMERLGIFPSDRQPKLLAGQLVRGTVEAENIAEALKSIERNRGLEIARQYATKVAGILEQIINRLAK